MAKSDLDCVDLIESKERWIIRLRGYIGTAESEVLDGTLNRVMAARPPLVIVDLADVELLASLGMGSLVRLGKVLAMHGGKVVIAAARPEVATSLRRARIDAVIPMFGSIQEAG